MAVGVLHLKLVIRSARSLKDKRRVLKSLIDRLRSRFNLSVAEVDALDVRQQAVVAAALVANDGQYVQAQLAKVVDFVRLARDCELADYEMEIL